MDIVKLSRELMKNQTEKNNSPPLLLTEIAVEKGKELSKKYKVDENLVIVSLYLAHTLFSPVWKDNTQKNHPKLSSKFVKDYLDKWGISQSDKEIILNSIEAHHNKVSTKSEIAEIVKNAECFKFVTLEGSLIYLHTLGKRGIPFKEAVDKVLQKMEQKRKLLTFDECIKEADKNCKKIIELFDGLN